MTPLLRKPFICISAIVLLAGPAHGRTERSCHGAWWVFENTEAELRETLVRPKSAIGGKGAYDDEGFIEARRSCPAGQPNECRDRARRTLITCAKFHVASSLNPATSGTLPVQCLETSNVKKYLVPADIVTAAKVRLCCDRAFQRRNSMRHMSLVMYIHGDIRCGQPRPRELVEPDVGFREVWTTDYRVAGVVHDEGPVDCQDIHDEFCPTGPLVCNETRCEDFRVAEPERDPERKPQITNASVDIRTAGQNCPKQATATVRIFGDGELKVRYRIQHQVDEYTSPWFDGRIKKTKILDGEGYALVAEHELERKLGPGQKKFRLQIEGLDDAEWQTVSINCPPLEAKSVVLSIKGSGEGVVCPHETQTEIEARTNGPGMITFHLRPVGGINSAPYRRMAKREGDAYFARYEEKNKVHVDINKTYEAVVKDGPVSNKATLKVTCIKPQSGELTLRKKAGSRCEAEALVAIHTNVGGTLPYELECGPGRSWQRTVQAKSANKIGVDKVDFTVKDKERVTCILRTRLGGQLKSLGGASQSFSCPTLKPRP